MVARDSIRLAISEPGETTAAARCLAECLRGGDSLGLVGDLGAGKTLFVQGLARGLGVPAESRVTSPTFTLVNEYTGGRLRLYHADLYRVERSRELEEIGLEDLCYGEDVVAVEWCDRFSVLPDDHVLVELSVTGESARQLVATGRGSRSLEVVASWKNGLLEQGFSLT